MSAMSCEEYSEKLMAYLDGELNEAEAAEVRLHVEGCQTCRGDSEKFMKMKEVAGSMKFIRPTDEVWDQHWTRIYTRVERGIAWMFLSIAAIILGVLGSYHLVADFFADPTVSIWVKLGVGAGIIGVVTLFVSVIRERIATYHVDPYKEVKR